MKAKKLIATAITIVMVMSLSTVALAASVDVSDETELEDALNNLTEGEYNGIDVISDIVYTNDITIDNIWNETTIAIRTIDSDLTLGDITVIGDGSGDYYTVEFYVYNGTDNGSFTIGNLTAKDGGCVAIWGNITGDVTADGAGSYVDIYDNGSIGGLVTASNNGEAWVYDVYGGLLADGGIIYIYGNATGDIKAVNGGYIYFNSSFYSFDDLPSAFTVGSIVFDTSVDNPTYSGRNGNLVNAVYTDGESYIILTIFDPQSSGKKALPAAVSGGSWSQNDDGTWSYLNPDGSKAAGWVASEDGAWYFLAPDGTMVTGWVMINGVWYYFAEDGVMSAGASIVIDGVTYTFDENGKCTNP